MGDIITYAQVYRDAGFSEKPFTEIDSLIFSELSYYNYAFTPFSEKNFQAAVQEIFQMQPDGLLKGLVTAAKDRKLVEVLACGGRHGSLRASNYIEVIDEENVEQFSAITFELETGIYYIAFRGTDCSVTGWKEDLCMSYRKEIPAQKAALEYALEVMERFDGNFYLGGHSKGGNLATFAAAHLPECCQKRIAGIYNHDGPGFHTDFYSQDGYQKIRPLIHKTVPQSSVFGMLLEEDSQYEVVRSTAMAALQHDPFTWAVQAEQFERVDSLDTFSQYAKRTLDRWLGELSYEERKKIVGTVFDVISGSGIHMFYELTEERIQKIRRILEHIIETEPEEKRRILSAVGRLFLISAAELPQSAKEEGVSFAEKHFPVWKGEKRDD